MQSDIRESTKSERVARLSAAKKALLALPYLSDTDRDRVRLLASAALPTTPPTSGDSSVERLAALLCDHVPARIIAGQEAAPQYEDSEPHVQAYWRVLAAALSPAVSSGVGEGHPISEAPPACHVLAGHIDPASGVWVMAVVASPPIQPFTHWWPLPDPSAPAPQSPAYTPRPAATDQAGEVERNLEAQRQTIEACARVADAYRDQKSAAAIASDGDDDHASAACWHARRIADGIRALRPNAALTQQGASTRPDHSPDGGAMVEALRGRPFSEWHEDHGQVLWWKLPIQEAPYVGSPLDLGRTMKVTVQVGREEHDLPSINTGGWPFDEEDEPDLWWTPLPSPTFFRAALSGAN